MTSDSRTMDLRLHANHQHHYRVNGGAGRSSRLGEDEALQFLSQEEQECIQFFEKTIDSLEDSLEDDRRPRHMRPPVSSSPPVETVDGPPTSSPIMSSPLARPPSPKDQDIIYLVRPEPDLVQTKEPFFSPTSPDFQSMVQNPESHFDMKPRRDPVDNLPSEYNAPLPNFGPTDSHAPYHPPGCIPTPVLIAQQIAENQAGGTSALHPSALLRRCSLDSDKPLSFNDPHAKQGPPTSAKPTRFPANISVILGGKEHQNQSLPNVNIEERRAQMLANLTGTSHPLVQENVQPTVEDKPRNIPTRSISFKDPSPDKSRMEALSKLGLTRNRAMSGGMSLLTVPDSTLPDPPTDAETSAKPLEASLPPPTETSTKLPEVNVPTPHQSQIHVDRKPEILQTDSFRKYEDRNQHPSPSPPAVTQSSFYPPPLETKRSFSPPPEITSLESNSYGGKSIVINPSVSSRSTPPTSPTSPEPKTLPPVLANPSEFNPYGGKSKVMTPAPVAIARSHLPDILSSHIDKTQTSEPPPPELNSYGGKSRTFNPSAGLNRPSDSPARGSKAPAPTLAPRPPRHSYHGATQKPALRALSPELKRRPASMFRPQGITVQFSGRGATDESRRDALRKLGLLKES